MYIVLYVMYSTVHWCSHLCKSDCNTITTVQSSWSAVGGRHGCKCCI